MMFWSSVGDSCVQAAPYQQTLNRSFTVGGLGLHTGEEGDSHSLYSLCKSMFKSLPSLSTLQTTIHALHNTQDPKMINKPCSEKGDMVCSGFLIRAALSRLRIPV